MNQQHTPGPWMVVKDVRARNYMVLRDLLGSGGRCELLKWDNGQVARFGTEELARAAIAKVTGSTK
jgi:hypothetical protein